MKHYPKTLGSSALSCIALTALALLSFASIASAETAPIVKLAEKEIRRYVYLRTGKLQPCPMKLTIDSSLGAQEYRITAQTIAGGSDIGVLYGAYRYVELLGVRFYLHGDIIPDQRLTELPAVSDTGKPLFELRGIQPFHDFMEGPDWWNTDDYLVYLAQLAKMRMNFIGLHNYPERHGDWPGPEPTVWIGLPGDADDQGRVTRSYPAFFASTQRPGWGNVPTLTSQYAGGAGMLFAGDVFGADAQAGHFPWPAEPEACNEVFNRTAAMYRDAFGFARSLGIKICVGTETPLTIPERVKERLRQTGRDPSDPAVARDLYKGMFQRIARAFPVDYYWLWTPEDWTWSGNKPGEFENATRDIQAALNALDDLGRPFTLATSGWVLGPAHNRAALDEFLPKDSPIACINRTVGHDGVEPAFANITGRPKWAIPWFENDPNMVGPQPWVARMRYEAVDARRFGCTGLMGLHWRTKALAMNISALAAAGWDQSWVPAGFDTLPVKPAKGGEGALGGSIVSFNEPVTNTGSAPVAVYQDVRYDLKGYNLAVPDGTYTVTLQLNEPAYHVLGARIFGAKLQGRQVVEHLDVFARAGQNKALDLSFPDIAVTDGTLRVEFTREVEFPCIAGIVVTGKTKAANQLASESFTRKINCGGSKVADYEADQASGGTISAAGKNRAMPVEDFYLDFARASFGEAVAGPAGRLLARIDGVSLPEVSTWKTGPGNLVANRAPWSEAQKSYAFVGELEQLRTLVKGGGNLERFDYWLNTYRGMQTMAEVSCLRGQLDQAMADGKYDDSLVTRIELAKAWTRLLNWQTAIVNTPGELGTIANLEHQTRGKTEFIEGHDLALAKALGRPLPPEAMPGKDYAGPARIVVLAVRGTVTRGESLNLKIIALDKQPVKSVTVHLRPLGKGDWKAIPATHIARAVYEAKLPLAQDDFEYYVSAETAGGNQLIWPATAPQLNQTVVTSQP